MLDIKSGNTAIAIENLKQYKTLDLLGQARQSGSALAA